MNIYKNKFLSRFGLMHMIATNLCVWLNVLILETSHEILDSHFRAIPDGEKGIYDLVHGGHDDNLIEESAMHNVSVPRHHKRGDFPTFDFVC